MQITDEIALSRCSAPDEPARSHVLIAGRRGPSTIDGCVLEAAVQCAPGWLWFATHDVPFEEALSISLLDAQGALLDSAELSRMYATGNFRELRLEPPSTVHFRFFDDADWRVELHEEPKLSLPWLPDAHGVRWGRQLQRWFAVRR